MLFKVVSFWYLLLGPHQTATYHSNVGCPHKKKNPNKGCLCYCRLVFFLDFITFCPYFFQHMLGAMVESTVGMMEELEKAVDSGGGSAEVEMEKLLETTTADIISRTAFGSSYKKGARVFEEQNKLYKLLLASDPLFSAPIFRFNSSHPLIHPLNSHHSFVKLSLIP